MGISSGKARHGSEVPNRQRSGSAPVFWPLLALSALISIGAVYQTRGYVMDDAMITLRYSHNFARYGVPFWNQADLQNPSMGYTSLLWMAINAVPALLTGNKDVLVLAAKLYSLASLLVIVWVVSRRVVSFSVSTSLKFLSSFLVFSQLGYGLHVNSAMETMLFSCTILIAVKAYSESQHSLAWVFGGLSFLARPEGAIVMALICGWDLWRRQVKRSVVSAVLFLVLLVGTSALLYHWYGDVLPNPFYAKQGFLNSGAVKRTVFFAVSLAAPFVAMSIHAAFWMRDRTSRYMLMTATVYILYYLSVDPVMNAFSRYQWPSLVMFTFASLPTVEFLFSDRRRHRFAISILVSSLILLNVANSLGASYFATATGHFERNAVVIGKRMAKYRDPGRWLVYHDAGAVCYFSDWNTHETVGLTNGPLARKQTTVRDILRNPNSQIAMHNFELAAGQQGGELEYARSLSKYGFQHVLDIPALHTEGQRNTVIAVYARDTSFADMVLGDLDLIAPLQPSFAHRLYTVVRRIVKGR